MNALDHYSMNLETIRLIPDEKIQVPGSIPMKVYLQEAENIYNWCQADREKLTANGLDWKAVSDMPARIDTLREAQSRWATSDTGDIEVEKRWNIEAPAALAFRKDLARSIRFAFRGNHAALVSIARMTEGLSHASVIQSLRNMAIFGFEHAEYLESKGYNMERFSAAADLSRSMAALLAAVNTRRSFSSDSLKLRNQAYTHLKQVVDELKAHAAYLFVHDEKRLRGYSSDYRRKKYLRSKNRKTAGGTVQQVQSEM